MSSSCCCISAWKRGAGGVTAFACVLAALVASVWCPSAARAEDVWVSGITEAIMDITMSTPVSGIVSLRRFEEGADVKKGEIMIELDRKLEQLEAQRKKHALELAQTELDRMKSLAQKNAISVSREELDKKQAEFNVASVEHELANEQIQRRLIAAPVDGQIAQIFKQIGESCEAQQPLVRVVDTRRCYFIANLDAKVGARQKVGARVKVEIDSGNGVVALDGVISYLAPVVDPASGLLKIKAVFENPDGKVRPGVAGRMLLQ